MTLTFIGEFNSPNYIALSSDIVDGKIEDASMIGGTVLLTDTNAWKIIDSELVLRDYVLPLSGGGGVTMDVADPTGLYHSITTPNALNDEFNDGSIDASWNQVNAHAGTIAWNEANSSLNAKFSSIAINKTASILKAGTLADGEAWEAHFQITGQPSTYPSFGLVITDGILTTSNAFVTWLYLNAGTINLGIQRGSLDNLSTAYYQVSAGNFTSFPVRVRMFRVDSTNYGMSFSHDGGAWLQTGLTYSPTFTPTHAGLWVSNWGTSEQQLVEFGYFRKVTV